MPTISPYLPPSGSTGITTEKASTTERKADTTVASTPLDTAQPARADALALSQEVESAMQEAEFDSRKVEALRDAISRGAYPLDPMKIADSFIELERLL